MENLKKLGKVLSKVKQKEVNGGFGGCDIAPPGCPCIVPPGHPCLNGGGGNGGSTGACFTSSGIIQISCTLTCPDGSLPFCP